MADKASSAEPSERYGTPPYPVRRFTVDEYLRLIESGLISEDERSELIDGWIVQEPHHRSPLHATMRDELLRELCLTPPPGHFVRCHAGLVLPDCVLSPDLTLVRGAPRSFSRRHPTADSAAVVIEISETSVERDRRKVRRCCEAGIPMALLINLDYRMVEVYDFVTADDNAQRRIRSKIVRELSQVGEGPLGNVIRTSLSWLQEIDAEQDSLQTE